MADGWNCPNCGKAHGPHVDTCPEQASAPVYYYPPIYRPPIYYTTPDVTPYIYPQTTCISPALSQSGG